MTKDKIAAVKLITGEEIICNLIELETEGSYTILHFSNPLRIQLRERRRSKTYALEPWLCIKNNFIHSIDISKIITVYEINDDEVLNDYYAFFRTKLDLKPKPKRIKSGNKIGYVGNINDFKNTLEKLYNDIDSYERPKDL